MLPAQGKPGHLNTSTWSIPIVSVQVGARSATLWEAALDRISADESADASEFQTIALPDGLVT